MRRLALLLRWSWRDLRSHWAKVVAIALVIAIGTGGYAGLTSTAEWRRVSYDTSYSRLAMYDLRVDLATGSFVPEGSLADAVAAIPHAGWISGVEERLLVPTQVDASAGDATILARGEITGSDFSGGGPEVNGYYAFTGRPLTGADSGRPLVMVNRNFAKVHEMADTGHIAVSGGLELEYVGQASTPEYFAVAPEGEMFMSDATFAGVFTTLDTAQELAGMPGMVNNLVLTLTPGADRGTMATELEQGLGNLAVGTTVSTRDDNLSYTSLTTDIDQDQAMFNALAILLFAGAVGAAFNLIHRLAEQQRREIGIGMALGVHPRLLAVRPLLVSAQIALLGVAFGIGVGVLIGNAMGTLMQDFVPLPVWDTSFQVGVFAWVAVIGVIVPFAATAIPVWRAVRVDPIDAIKPSYLSTGGATVRHRRLRRPNTFVVMPFRNLRRTPRRTALTVLGIAAAVTVLVAFLGIMDSVFYAVDTAEAESSGSNPERIEVALDSFYLAAGPEVAGVAEAESVAEVEPMLRLVASIRNGGEEIDTILELVDLRDGMWSPTFTQGEVGDTPGIVLTEKAASDLGVGVGDSITLRHPRREGMTSYAFVDSELPVVGLHPHPVRGFSYMDIANADLMALAGITNAVNVMPVAGVSATDVQQELFELEAVASVQSVTAVTEAVRDAFDQMLGIIQVMVVAVLLLALLIAFNTAAINLDARSREHATMFAFGVRVRTAMRMAVTESFVIGVTATIIGIGGGLAMVWWMTERLLAETLPDFDLEVAIQPSTIAVVVVMGVIAVSLAPLLTARRMRKMNLPGTLRYVE
jgi:putative ABC transport system permease protein